MKNVYLVCENIDMGYDVIAAHVDQGKANSDCDQMNKKFNTKLMNDLQAGCKYTKDQATKFVNQRAEQFFVKKVPIS